MISIIITSFKEPKTIGKAITSFTRQQLPPYELIVSAPDTETLDVARKYARKNKRIRVIQDAGKGKPAALNRIFRLAKGDILILSDGDVSVDRHSVKVLLSHFSDPHVGAVTGRVVSTNNPDKMMGFWASLLTEGFHSLRLRQSQQKEQVICSGYLYALRRGLVANIPEDILADDAYISLLVDKKGYLTVYEPSARVLVKYPTSLPDWIRQKKRTAGRLYQLKRYFAVSKASSFRDEIVAGIKSIFSLRSFRKIFWFGLLVIMRLYIWFRVFFDYRLWNRSFARTWERVETTK